MTNNRTESKSQIQPKSIAANICFAVCLCIIVLRATFTEGINTQSSSAAAQLSSIVVSLAFSSAMIAIFVFLLCRWLLSKKQIYRFTAMEIPLLLFFIAAITSVFFASNRRIAVNSITILIAPILMALALTQIINSASKIKLLLIVIAALGFLSSAQCFEQLSSSNEMTIQQYEQDPESMLKPLGITPGTFQQFLFEHRIYSKGIKGYFMTSNSAGSFAIMASFAAFALFYNAYKKFKADSISRDPFFASAIAFVIILAGFFITKSKGALASGLIGAVMLTLYLRFPETIKKHPRKLFILCSLIFLSAVAAIVCLGISKDTLPGGNSMLVRWQYWKSTALMAADHWLIGIGPGNFANYYTQYKTPAALETVADPHNFIFSIFTQTGTFGLLFFLMLIFLPIKKAVSKSTLKPIEAEKADTTRPRQVIYLILIAASMLFVRPLMMKFNAMSSDPAVILYVIIVLYIIPILLFILAFFLFASSQKNDAIKTNSVTSAAIFCSIIAVLMHNLIDFAIFEPSVYTTFWAMVALLIAMNLKPHKSEQVTSKRMSSTRKTKKSRLASFFTSYKLRFIFAVLIIILFVPVVAFTLVVPAIADHHIKAAIQNPDTAISHLEKASKIDTFNTVALSLLGKFYIQGYSIAPNNPQLLDKASQHFMQAVSRDKADYKNYEKLADIYTLAAKATEGSECEKNLILALKYAKNAIDLYPGSAKLRIKYAQVADQLKLVPLAIEQYQKAIEIENTFVEQFRQMYPDRDIVSRVGNEKYRFAIERLKVLDND